MSIHLSGRQDHDYVCQYVSRSQSETCTHAPFCSLSHLCETFSLNRPATPLFPSLSLPCTNTHTHRHSNLIPFSSRRPGWGRIQKKTHPYGQTKSATEQVDQLVYHHHHHYTDRAMIKGCRRGVGWGDGEGGRINESEIESVVPFNINPIACMCVCVCMRVAQSGSVPGGSMQQAPSNRGSQNHSSSPFLPFCGKFAISLFRSHTHTHSLSFSLLLSF